jgi:hypothetical protein
MRSGRKPKSVPRLEITVIDYIEPVLDIDREVKLIKQLLLANELEEAQQKCADLSILILKLYSQIRMQSKQPR